MCVLPLLLLLSDSDWWQTPEKTNLLMLLPLEGKGECPQARSLAKK